jgi:hypothetical protein
VTRNLLDTNIIGNVTRPAPSESLLTWMAQQADEDLFIASLTVAEIRRDVLEKRRTPRTLPERGMPILLPRNAASRD